MLGVKSFLPASLNVLLPTSSAVLFEQLPLRKLLEVLLGPEGKRRLMLRHMNNEDLFKLYDSDLVLRLHNAKNLSDTKKVLARYPNR